MRLHDYQARAVNFLLTHDDAALWLPVGAGKTATTLRSLEALPALVVAPKRVAEHVWPDEQPLWRPDLTLALAAGDADKRRKALRAGADITVLGRDNIKDAEPDRYRTIILDESSGFKDQASARFKAARKLRRPGTMFWELTGTPSPNGLVDIWSQIALLDGEVVRGGHLRSRRLGSLTNYRNRYFQMVKEIAPHVYEWAIRPEAEKNIYRLIEDLCFSLPPQQHIPTTFNTLKVDLPKPVKGAYRELARELMVDLEVLGGEIHSAANAAVLTNKLSQVAAGFLYNDDASGDYVWLHDEKIEVLKEIRAGTPDNMIVFYGYQPERERILATFPEAVPIEAPDAVRHFMEGKISMLVTHPASAAHGLNLQHHSHTMVWMTLDWSLELWLQGLGRLARQGQLKDVMVHIVQAVGTVDAKKYRRLLEKEYDQEDLLDHIREASR